MIRPRTIRAAVVAAFLLSGLPVRAVTVGQVDSFEDGTTAGWGAGAPRRAPPQNQADGGRGGAGDNYLRLTATGNESAGGSDTLGRGEGAFPLTTTIRSGDT